MLSMREYLVFTSGLEQEKKFSDSLIVLERFDSWRLSSLVVSTPQTSGPSNSEGRKRYRTYESSRMSTRGMPLSPVWPLYLFSGHTLYTHGALLQSMGQMSVKCQGELVKFWGRGGEEGERREKGNLWWTNIQSTQGSFTPSTFCVVLRGD